MNRFKMVTKRALSIFLCMVMLLTVMFSVPLSVNAETAQIHSQTRAEAVENNDENISYDVAEENTEQDINIEKEEKAYISDVGSDTLNEFEVDGIIYAEIDSVSVKVIGYNKELVPDDVVIPETVEGKTVTEVGENAFGRSRIKSIVLPETVTTVGPAAFYYCSALKTATILGELTTIEDYTFQYCNLSEIVWPDSITHIGKSAFWGSSFESIDFPKNLQTIAEYAFNQCVYLKQLTIPSSVTSIGKDAFECNYSLTEVMFEERTTLLPLGEGAFSSCTDLISFDFTYCSKLDRRAFGGCTSLTSIALPDGVDITSGINAFSNCTSLKTAKLPENADVIPEGFFSGCVSLETVEAGKIKSVGDEAFKDCSSLVSFDFTNCTDISEGAFYGCTSLQSVQTNKIENIGDNAFENCSSIVDFDFSFCTSIGNSAFQGCTGFTSMNIPSNVVKLGGNAFSNCTGLTCVTLPDSITIGAGAFSGCTNLKTVNLSDNIESIPSSCFSDCVSLETVQTGKIKSIGSQAFNNCCSLTSFDFSSCTIIGYDAFSKCTGFTSVTLPDNVTTIGTGTFSGCTNLKTVKLSDNIESIPSSCFSGCESLEKVQAGEINSVDFSAFYNCINLTDISFAKNSIDTVGLKAFENCSKLTEIDLHKVAYIENSAFKNCTALTKVNLEGNTRLTSIGYGAFGNCTSLEKIDIPSSCKEICETAFMNCHSLSEVTLREGLEEIKQQAFFNCYSLYQIFIPNSVSLIEAYAFACFEYEDEVYIYSDFTVLGSPDSLADEYAEMYMVKYENAIPAPKLTAIANTDSGIKLSFEKLSSVSGYYRVYRKTAGTSWTKLADVTTSSYTDTTAVAGTKYTYTVKFIGNDGTTSLYDKNGLSITRLKTPSVSKIENTASGAKITFSAVAGASKYRVYYKTSDGWKSIGDTQETSFVHADAVSGTTYTYTVKAFDSDGMGSAHNSTGWSNKYIATPYVNSAEVTNGGVKLTWDKVAGAENYRVFVKNGSSWKGLATVSGATTSYVDKTATAGNTYTYTIRCMDSKSNPVSDYDKEGFTVRYLETPQITGFENIDGGTVITWNGVEGAEKYRLYVKKDGSWKMLFDVEGTSYTHLDLVEGTEYTYTIRCVSEDSKIFESGFDSTGFSNIYEKPEITVLIGDADLDGELSVMDASLIQMYLVGKKTIEGEALIAADADVDGEISVMDASLIQMILVGKK